MSFEIRFGNYSDYSELIIIAIVGVILLIVFIIDCCTGSTPRITKGRRRLRRTPQEPQFVNVTQLNTEGPVRVRIPLRDNQDATDEDGFVLVPEHEADHPATPVVQPPYPVEALHPTPHAPPPAGYAHNPPYPTHAPHPVPGAAPYPPMTTPYPPAAAPYPPSGPPVGMAAPYPDYSANPPTYSEAVSQAPVRPPPNTSENYAKQSPYNPNY